MKTADIQKSKQTLTLDHAAARWSLSPVVCLNVQQSDIWRLWLAHGQLADSRKHHRNVRQRVREHGMRRGQVSRPLT